MGTEIVGREREQPQSDRVWSIETNGINAIPDAERHGRPIELFWIWFAANISILGMFYGLALVTFYGLNLGQALAAGVLGTVISFLLVGLISLAGKRGGAPTLTLSRAPFGVVGKALPTLVSYLALVGWRRSWSRWRAWPPRRSWTGSASAAAPSAWRSRSRSSPRSPSRSGCWGTPRSCG
jgi:cytosine/uracil/thiamine/allantoin permease